MLDTKEFIKYSQDVTDSLEFLTPLSDNYPGINIWFKTKVIIGLELGTRKLFIHRRSGKIVALGIAKKTESEKKICTVRVAPEYVGKGLGVKIFKQAIDWLETEQPHLTVSEDKLLDFERIFDHFGFRLTSTINGLYQPGKVEYLFNEKKSFLGK
ncbi:GNAT family N-acetyltransferase [Pseudoalteromonas phenolica]|uniref:GNAT family N-acetyltransferase n=1 Tax=Pseudoalteromonas phenolica TaxID=161398 RepID=UPI00148653D1|nr:GNAT family N-acetyltransferase [Pseudoalteromonas phenolica]